MRSLSNNPRGSITLVALCLAIVIGISLASYLALCQQSLLLSTRTIQLSKARQLAETGLEEALWSLNAAANPNAAIAATAWSNASWSPAPTAADKNCTITGYDLGNGATGQITITIANFNGPTTTPAVPTPIITSAATVSIPGLGDFTKTLTATTRPAPLFPNAIGVLNGNVYLYGGTAIDSWDSDYDPTAVAPTPSRDYNISTPPVLYSSVSHPPASTNPGNYAAVVAAPDITIAPTAIYGYVATFGNAITPLPSSGCIIKGPSSPASPTIDPSRVGKSAFIPFFDVKAPSPPPPGTWHYLPPYAAWSTSSPVSIVTASPNIPEYWHTDISTAAEDNLIIDSTKNLEITGYVILVVQKDLELRDNAQIVIKPNSRLEIYVRDDVRITSSNPACFSNQTNEPKNLALFCTRESGGLFTFDYQSPSTQFIGVIFSADTNQHIQFDNTIEIQGAVLAGYTPRFSAGGNTTIHYDTALQYLPKNWFKGVTTPFMITQVTENP